MGTADAQDFIMKSHNVEHLRLASNGNTSIKGNDGTAGLLYDATNNRVGIGTQSPTEKFEVVGNAKISGTTTTDNLQINTSFASPLVTAGNSSTAAQLAFSVVGHSSLSGDAIISGNTTTNSMEVGTSLASPLATIGNLRFVA